MIVEIKSGAFDFAFSAEDRDNKLEDEEFLALMQQLPSSVVQTLLEKALLNIERERKCELPLSG
jgi:hypothetical protein